VTVTPDPRKPEVRAGVVPASSNWWSTA
jgi:hypothetical protein